MLSEKRLWQPLIFCFLGVIAHAQNMNPAPLTVLQFGQTMERQLKGGQSEVYQISLSAGDFLRVEVEQRGIDIELKIFDPAQQKLVQMDSFNGTQGADIAAVIAAQSGDYRVEVVASDSGMPPGRYEIKVAQQRRATAEDQKWIQAQTAYVQGIQLRAQPVADSKRQAMQRFEDSLKIWQELGDSLMTAHSLYYIASGHRSFGDQPRGFKTLLQAQEILQAARETREDATLLTNLAIYADEPDKEIAYYEQALKIWRQQGDSYGEARALSNLARRFYSTGDNGKALAMLQQSLSYWQKIKSQRGIADTLLPMGQTYDVQGEWQKSLECYEQALTIFRAEKYWRGEGQVLLEIGVIYDRLQDDAKWLDYSQQALSLWRRLGDRSYIAAALINVASAESNLGSSQSATDHFNEAIKLHQEIGNRQGAAVALRELGRHYARLRNFQSALDCYQQSLALSANAADRRKEDITRLSIGETYHALQRYDEAEQYYQQSLVIARENQNPSTIAVILYRMAANEASRGNLTQARQLLEENIRVSESLRAGLISPAARSSYFASVQSSYDLYADVLMRQHQDEPLKQINAMALEISERQRARSLLDLLTESRTNLREGVDAALVKRENTLAQQLNGKAQQLSRATKAEQIAALKQEVSQLEIELESAQAEIRKASPRYAALTKPQPLTLPQIQQLLDADTLLLEYALGTERSYLWAVAKDSLTSYELPKGKLIKQSAQQLYALLIAPSLTKRGETIAQRRQRIVEANAQLPAAAQALSQLVLAPVAAQLGNKRLVIVADGALQYVPFAALPEPVAGGQWSVVGKNPNQPPATSHQPLIVKHEIISLPSASALAIQRREIAGRQIAPKLLAVIADPVFERNDARLTNVNATSSNDAQTRSYIDERSIVHLAENTNEANGAARRFVIPRLPFTKQEATRLLALAPKSESLSALDFQANRAAVLSPALSQYRYVHFATHGVLDSERPGLSSLLLSMVDEQGKSQDGFLRANDIYNLKLPAELVVLSACQTGLGKEIKGEGLVGLTRGFMYAGAARVVVSLWNVNDQATAELMTKFYQKMLKQGERPAAALRAAQVELWKQKQWNAPFYWAAFTLQGEWR